MKRTALILLHPGFEEMEAVAPIDLLARAGVEVTQVSLSNDLLVEGRNGITMKADCALSDLSEGALYDALILPGGPGINEIRDHPHICQLFARHHSASKIVACICAAPLLLLDAGLVENLNYTAHPATLKELPRPADEACVLDGNVLTSRGAGTATEFGLALVEALTNRATRDEVAASICWQHG